MKRRIALLTLAGGVLVAACQSSSGKSYATLTFPSGFLWGTATAAYQVEGGNTKDDWYAWEHLPGKILNGDTAGRACDEYDLYDQDFALAASLGQNAHRFSIEWSRIEPVYGAAYDTAEIAHYHAELASLRAHGLRPVVTLEHYTLPLWADNPALGPNTTGTAGWASATTQAEFVKWVGNMAQEYGAQVDDWIVFNEPMVAAVASYAGVFPPDLGSNPALSDAVAQALGMIRAHAAAYDAIHARDMVSANGDGVAARVGIAQNLIAFYPASTGSADLVATRRIDHIYNKLFIDAVTSGNLDTSLTGAYAPANVGVPSLKNRLDFIGVNYYRKYLISGVLAPPILGLPLDDPSTPHNDLGWSIYPRGIYEEIAEMATYGLPIIVTENGIADAADTRRPAYLVDHLVWVHKAIEDGYPVKGYLQWSLMDNFEWAQGFHARFGELHTDYPTEARDPITSTGVFSQICHANALPGGLQDAYRTTSTAG